MADVFISYSRTDSEFVRALDAHLKGEGRDVWVDWEDIAPAADWQQDIYDNIDAANSFVFVVSPRSLASEYCGKELTRALAGGKRIVPIACDGADPSAAPPSLAERNWIWCRTTDDHPDAFAKLSSALETDLEWVKAHTRLLVRAVEWDARGGDRSVLLRGRDLADAESSLATSGAKEPTPTELQQRYVHASRRSAVARQRLLLGGVFAALAVSIALAIAATLQRNTANARARTARAQSEAIRSEQALATSPATALADAVEAEGTKTLPETRAALRAAILASPVAYSIHASAASRAAAKVGADAPHALAFADHGRLLVGLMPDGTLHTWRGPDGRPVGVPISRIRFVAIGADGAVVSSDGSGVRIGGVVRYEARNARVAAIGFAGARPLALVARNGDAAVVDVATGKRVRLAARRVAAATAAFSADGSRALTEDSFDTEIQVWDTRTGRRVANLPGGVSPALSGDGRFVATACCVGGELWSVDLRRRIANLPSSTTRVVFSPDSKTLAAIGTGGATRLYATTTGAIRAVVPDFGAYSLYLLGSGAAALTSFDPAAAFVRRDRVAIANSDGFVRLWQPSANRVLATVATGYANAIAVGPGGLLATMTWDGEVAVSRLPSTLAFTAAPASSLRRYAPVFDDSRSSLVVPTATGVLVASGDGAPVASHRLRLSKGAAQVAQWAISADGSTVAAASGYTSHAIDTRFHPATEIWRAGATPRHLPGATTPILLTRDGSVVAFDGRAWQTASGVRVRALDGVRLLSRDGRRAVVRRHGTAVVVDLGRANAPAVPLRGFGTLASDDEVDGGFGAGGTRILTRSSNGLRLWDAATGTEVARLGRSFDDSGFFTADGSSVVVIAADRVTVFAASEGKPQLAVPGRFDAVSPDGRFAASITGDGAIAFVDLGTGAGGTVQPDGAVALQEAWFGGSDEVLFAVDSGGGVHRIRCAICAPEGVLLARARAELARLPRIRRPPVQAGAVG